MEKLKKAILFLIIMIVIIIIIISIIIYFMHKSLYQKNTYDNIQEQNSLKEEQYHNYSNETKIDESKYSNEESEDKLFESSYSNYAHKETHYGYYIYSNGVISEFDEYDKERNLKSAMLTNEELVLLKELSNIIQNEFVEKPNMMQDAGTATKKIYSEKLSKWVLLSSRRRRPGR